MRKSCSICSNH